MSRMRYLSALVATLVLAACAPAGSGRASTGRATPPPAPRTVRDLVTRMQGHYAGRWYGSLSFRQENVSYTSAGESRSTWFERQSVPKRLRIDFVAPVADGSGTLFRNDSVYSFQNGRLAQGAPQLHPLLLLSADLYALPADTVMAALARLAVDTTTLRAGDWEGRRVWVAGAAAGDSTSDQLWVDAERWVLLRLVYSQRAAARTIRTDYHFSYQTVDSLPVPREIVFLRDGKPYWRESYTDVRVNPPIADSVFTPGLWSQGVPTP